MEEAAAISELPNVPAVYALYGGRGRGQQTAYVGVTDKLRQRITQHLVRRDSSVVTGVSVVSLNPGLVTEVRWWIHPTFQDPAHISAAEFVAFDVLEPVLRSRGATEAQALALYTDETFSTQMRDLFQGPPTGRLVIPTLEDAMERIAALERRLATVEAKLGRH